MWPTLKWLEETTLTMQNSHNFDWFSLFFTINSTYESIGKNIKS